MLQQGVLHFVTHKQMNNRGRGITHYWSGFINETTSQKPPKSEGLSEAQQQRLLESYDSINALRHQRVVNVLDSIRLTFAMLGKEASESYCYEFHKGEIDTIKYTLYFREKGDTLLYPPVKFTNWSEINGAREIANFEYSRNYDDYMEGNVEKGTYSHLYHEPTGFTWDEMKPFDVKAFEAQIAPALKSFMKLKGAKTYPVHWQHDEGFEDDVKKDGGLIQKVKSAGSASSGLTQGTHYFIPAKYREEADTLYKQLVSLAYNYVNSHPEQFYEYLFTSRFSLHNFITVVESHSYHEDNNYYLGQTADENGFHLFLLTNKGDLWVPRDFQKLKSYINGKVTYLKGMEPKNKLK